MVSGYASVAPACARVPATRSILVARRLADHLRLGGAPEMRIVGGKLQVHL